METIAVCMFCAFHHLLLRDIYLCIVIFLLLFFFNWLTWHLWIEFSQAPFPCCFMLTEVFPLLYIPTFTPVANDGPEICWSSCGAEAHWYVWVQWGKKRMVLFQLAQKFPYKLGEWVTIIGGCMLLIWNMNEIFQMVKAEMKCWIPLLSYLLLSVACLKG